MGRHGFKRLGLGRMRTLARLRHMALDGLIGTRAVLGGVGVGETGPGGVVTVFDGCEPRRANREGGIGVEIENKSLYTRKVVCA